MVDNIEQLKCVLLTVNENRLILPNAAIAEILPVRNMINVANKPPWMLGFLDWRGNSVPLVSFELLGGVRMPSLAKPDVKAVVLYSVADDQSMPYISFLVQGAPQAISVANTDVISSNEKVDHPGIKDRVTVRGDAACIVDMEGLESVIKNIMT